jgi:hypothetical protein
VVNNRFRSFIFRRHVLFVIKLLIIIFCLFSFLFALLPLLFRRVFFPVELLYQFLLSFLLEFKFLLEFRAYPLKLTRLHLSYDVADSFERDLFHPPFPLNFY